MNLAASEPVYPFSSCREYFERRTCMLLITHGCNLNCTYCYEKFKNGSKKMDISLAKKIIHEEIEIVKNDKRFKELEIDFMGGEPLLRFDLIKEIVEWMETSNHNIPFICFASTNGTLISEEMKTWFRNHRKTMVLGISYDGIENAQNINRGEQAKNIDLDFFCKTWPFQGFKMTISKNSLHHLYDSFFFAHKNGYKVIASLAQGEEWNNADAKIFYEQLCLLKNYYLENPQHHPCNFLTRPLTFIGSPKILQSKFCGSGTYMATYDTDGAMYGCHMFTPLVLGNRAMKHQDFNGWEDEQQMTDNDCRGCGLLNWCPTCIGFNMLDRNSINKRDRRWCAMNAAEAMAACQYQLEYFLKEINHRTLNDHEICVLNDALNAYGYLSSINIQKEFPQ